MSQRTVGLVVSSRVLVNCHDTASLNSQGFGAIWRTIDTTKN